MIRPRTAISVERRNRCLVDLAADGVARMQIGPRAPGRQYVTLVLGEIDKGQMVSDDDIIEAAEDLCKRMRELALADATVQP